MTTIINASNTTGLTLTSDLTGTLSLQSAGTAVANISSTGFSTPNNINVPNTFGFKNRIINGGMVIDQRNAGASVTPTAGVFSLDRWKSFLSGTMSVTVQQSTTAPVGFINSAALTVATADTSIASGDHYIIEQPIEGLNCSDFGFGTADAKTVTVSFWVRSSITGTYCGALTNSAENRAYVFSYTINSANIWEQKSITIAGDTSGTWLTNNGLGIRLRITLSAGSSFQGTGNTWQSSNLLSTSAQTQWVSTAGATFYITGVQLEVGSQATSFDFRSYPQELDLCERYYEKGSFTIRNYSGGGGTACGQFFPFAVTKRTSASMTASNTSYAYNCSGLVLNGYICGFEEYVSTTAAYAVLSDWAASAEL